MLQIDSAGQVITGRTFERLWFICRGSFKAGIDHGRQGRLGLTLPEIDGLLALRLLPCSLSCSHQTSLLGILRSLGVPHIVAP